MLKRILSIVCVLMLFPVLAFAEVATITVTKQSPEFRVTEPSNSTTGYRWRVEYDKSLLTLTREVSFVPHSKLIGAGGKTIWFFKATPKAFNVPHTETQVHLIYERPWDKNDNPTELFFVVEFH